MFRSILSKSLRDYRVPMLAWSLGLLVFMAVVVTTATPAVVTAFISFARIVSFLGDPYAMHTPEGYITFRYMATTLPLLLSIWPILAGARLVRGEEERGTMDVLLATSQTRTRLLLRGDRSSIERATAPPCQRRRPASSDSTLPTSL